jgi:FkbM family methyltransferase
MTGDETLAYDIGAFGGDSIESIRSLGYESIVCFEPHPDAFFRLKRDHHDPPRITTENYAVSSESGKLLKMYSSPDHPWVNTLEEDWIKIQRHSSLNHTETAMVETITLNDYIEKSGKIPAYIKIDAEGHEYEILKGLSYPPRMISFEWISERLDKTSLCLELIFNLGLRDFKICFGEKIPEFENDDDFYSVEECIHRLRAINEIDFEIEFLLQTTSPKLWGNIWCK